MHYGHQPRVLLQQNKYIRPRVLCCIRSAVPPACPAPPAVSPSCAPYVCRARAPTKTSSRAPRSASTCTHTSTLSHQTARRNSTRPSRGLRSDSPARRGYTCRPPLGVVGNSNFWARRPYPLRFRKESADAAPPSGGCFGWRGRGGRDRGHGRGRDLR